MTGQDAQDNPSHGRRLMLAVLMAVYAACNDPNAEKADPDTTTSTGTGTSSASATSSTEATHSFSGPETVDCDINPCRCGKGWCPAEQCMEEICVPPDCTLGAENCPCHADSSCDAGLTCNEETCVFTQESTSDGDATTNVGTESSTGSGPRETSSSTGSTSGTS